MSRTYRCNARSKTMRRLCFCSNSPTAMPTSAPTPNPTPAPSSTPTTYTPTVYPTHTPTPAPTPKRKPGWVPGMPFMIGALTANPTGWPTLAPTTHQPTVAPTSSPSMLANDIWHHLSTQRQWGVVTSPKTQDDDGAKTSAETAEVDKYLHISTPSPTPEKESTNHRNKRIHNEHKQQRWRVEFIEHENEDDSCPYFLKRSRCPSVEHGDGSAGMEFLRKPDTNTFAILRGTIAAADKGQDKSCRACLGMGTADCVRCAQPYMYPVGNCEPHSTQFWCTDGV